ncbi:Putative stage IV sporulation YqfD [Acididesulfobacillus acetoxydans]|uniref:Sporulation protein YqfD n=1 Tax=Acididesulfobacillus acetoxydans TaxID=1561005 RepID=A0A8S0Y4Z4_9FIRM|nr:sporulation protein YqfD [Acididesulfobacillus acetoxydans]CAA7603475.1 Putative stage IV sporulation YqfD [Acididesulfobacillus acetoxydans]CEJ06822.1 Sporulation protein YqfD [Acididesulfobacillus acetoxydans]
MFARLTAFWRGRVHFAVRCGNPAAFINATLQDGITLFHMQKAKYGLRAQVSLQDFPRLRRAARRARAQVKITARYGWPFIAARWRRRKGLLVGLVLVAVALSILSQLVLFISVNGNKKISSAELLQKAQSLGLKSWVWHKNLDLDRIATGLEDSFPDLAWVGIDRNGTHVQINVAEKIRPKAPAEEGNLVAARAGVVEQVIVIQGVAQVHEGETVRAGQVLIAKAPPASPLAKAGTAPPPARAKGFVRGRVWYSAEATVPLKEDKVAATGRVGTGWGIKIGPRVIMVTTPESPYPLVRKDVIARPLLTWRNWRFPVEVIMVRYQELQQVHLTHSPEEARRLAEERARAEVQSKITPGATPLAEKVLVMPGPDTAVRVRVEEETFEDLAVYANANGGE